MTSHRGRIWCESQNSGQSYVAFYFTLPLDERLLTEKMDNLPRHASELRRNSILTCRDDDVMAKQDGPNEEKILDYLKKIDRNLTIAILDDESIYRYALERIIKGEDDELSNRSIIRHFSDPNLFIASLQKEIIDFAVCDVDLGKNAPLDGFETVKVIREKKIKTPICLHSNRSLPEDFQRAIDAGAEAFFPKPMTRSHFMGFLATNIDDEK